MDRTEEGVVRANATYRSLCWCGMSEVDVTPEMTKSLRTASCGEPGCHSNHAIMRGVNRGTVR